MPDAPLVVETSASDSNRIIRLKGPLTLMNVFKYQDTFRGQTSPLTILDLTGVPYIDSAGIGALVNSLVSCQNGHRKLALVGVNDHVKSMLVVTHLENLFATFPTASDAQSAMA